MTAAEGLVYLNGLVQRGKCEHDGQCRHNLVFSMLGLPRAQENRFRCIAPKCVKLHALCFSEGWCDASDSI